MEPAPEESNMTLIRTVLLTSGLVLTVYGGEALAQSSAPGASSTAAAGRPLLTPANAGPSRPGPSCPKPATTALLVFDIVDPICKVQPKCTGVMVPAVASLLAQARKAGVFVLYSSRAPTISKWLPEVTPAPADPIITSYAQDRFYNTDLDKTLKAKGITTVILTGWKVSGSVVYTSVGATLRDYTVVVPVDASLATTDYEVAIGLFQILTQNSANATNEPLKAKASTLSRTDMITFQ
jgi:nicotinamidase-related amidase